MGEAWDALNALLEKLKDSCLLLDSDDNQWVRMHDLVHDVAKRISYREQYVLKVAHGDELKEWPDNKEWCEKCTMLSLQTSNIPKLPEVLQCKELKLFHVSPSVENYSLEIPCNFFKETTKLRVLDLSSLSIPSLPPSLQFLKNLRPLCLDRCTLGEIALIGQLQNLEILSFLRSKFKQLPEEIGKLTRLRLLDLTGCSQLELISPNVISSLKSLEELRMGNSFNRWEAAGVIRTERNNASLSELKHLPQLSVLLIHILDANILLTDLFSNALERYQIYIGAAWTWRDADVTLNTLKLNLTTSNELDESGITKLLKRTDELYLDGTEAGKNNVYQSSDGEGFQQLKHLHVRNAEFKHIINGKGIFLTKLVVSDIVDLRSLLSSSMARSLVQLTHLQISRCPILEDIISTIVSDEENMANVFSKLQYLELESLPNLTRFCSRSCMEFPSLEIQQFDNRKEIEEMDSNENLEDMVEHCLFDKKLKFPSLKRLLINGLKKLMKIWHNQLSPESFKNLESIDIRCCESLKIVFPSSLIRSLQQLMELKVVSCGVEVIVASEEGLQTTPKFVFTKVTSVRFNMLPQLESFYPGMHASSWPSLESLEVYSCNKVDILAEEFSNFKGERESANHTHPTNQTLFLIEQDSFSNLEELGMSGMEIWDGPFPVKFFSKLIMLRVGNPHSKSTTVLEQFLDLEKVNVTSAPSDQTSFHVGNSSGNIPADWILPHLRELWLYRMYKLMHLGEDNSQQPGQNFPNLEILLLKYCNSLKNLKSSSISFKNLTTLQVSDCPALEYLITYSTAKSSMQLTKLEVENCIGLTAIVGSNGDDSGNEIAFSRLKHLKLSLLPRMRGFCSINCTVNFPLLETLSMSNRLKSKMFHKFHFAETLQITNERGDTDVDSDDDEMVTEENDHVDIGANGEHDDEIAQTTNENDDANVAEMCSEMPSLPVLSVRKAHLFEWKNARLMCVIMLVCVLMLVFGTYIRDLVV